MTTVCAMENQPTAIQSCNPDWASVFQSCNPLQICYASGEMISQAGSFIAGVQLIIDGVASDTVHSLRYGPRSIGILAAGDLIGLELLAHQSNSISSSVCRALTPVSLLFIETGKWNSLLDADSRFERSVLHYVATKHLQARESIPHLASVEGQLCNLLKLLAQSCGVYDADGIVSLPADISLQGLGDLLGMSSRQLRQARQRLQTLTKREACIAFDMEEIGHLVCSA